MAYHPNSLWLPLPNLLRRQHQHGPNAPFGIGLSGLLLSLFLSLLLFASLAAAQTSAVPGASGLLVELNGGGTLTVAKRTVPPALFAPFALPATAELRAGAQWAVLLKNPNRLYRLTGPATVLIEASGAYTLTANSASNVSGATGKTAIVASPTLPKLFQQLNLDQGDAAQASIVMRTAAVDGLAIDLPRGKLAPTEHPRFTWHGVALANSYQIEVATLEGDLVFRSGELPGSPNPTMTLSHSPQNIALTPGTRYRFSITARLKNGKTQWNWGEFAVASDAQWQPLQALKPNAGAASIETNLYALALGHAGFHQAALAVMAGL